MVEAFYSLAFFAKWVSAYDSLKDSTRKVAMAVSSTHRMCNAWNVSLLQSSCHDKDDASSQAQKWCSRNLVVAYMGSVRSLVGHAMLQSIDLRPAAVAPASRPAARQPLWQSGVRAGAMHQHLLQYMCPFS